GRTLAIAGRARHHAGVKRTFLALCLLASTAHATNRVVLVRDPAVLDGRNVNAARAAAMVNASMKSLTSQTNLTAAWQQLFSSNDVVGIKVSTVAAPAHVTHPEVLAAIAAGLQLAGVASTNIIIFDRDPKKLRDAGYTGLRVAAIIGETGWDAGVFIESPSVGKLIWGDLEFGKEEPLSNRSHFPKLLTQTITKLINVPVLMDHEAAGLAGCLYNVTLGMADNVRRFEQPGQRPDPAIIELYARPELRRKLVLNIADALYAGYAGGPAFKPQYSWPYAGLYFSRDAVALDAVCLDLVEAKRQEQNVAPIGDRAGHVMAAGKAKLGQVDREQIELVEVTPVTQ
ncbi:MAG: DUF362 domain-containing protein, partial [Verrucomicrobiota bacterium]